MGRYLASSYCNILLACAISTESIVTSLSLPHSDPSVNVHGHIRIYFNLSKVLLQTTEIRKISKIAD
jgi:hypothetical protein